MINQRIAILCPSLDRVGGIQTFVRDHALGFQKRGWDVHLIATNTHGDLHDEIAGMVKCHDFSGITLSLNKVRGLADLLNEINPKILMSNHCSLSHYSFPLLKAEIQPAVILHSSPDVFFQTASLFKSRVWRWVAPTPRIAALYKHWLPEKLNNRVAIIPHGISKEIFFRKTEISNEPKHKLVFAGSFLPHKGVDLLPAILERVKKEIPLVHLTIIGDGASRKEVSKNFIGRGLQDAVTWYGKVPQKLMAKCFHQSDIFLFPSRGESFGLVIAEAMMSGIVPVTTRLEGITDTIIEDGVSGFIIPLEDIEGYAKAIIRLFQVPELLYRMKKKAIAQALSRFTQERMLDDYEKLYCEADDRKPTQPAYLTVWIWETIWAYFSNASLSGGFAKRFKKILYYLYMKKASR